MKQQSDDATMAELLVVRACARLVALGRIDLAATLRLGGGATLVLWQERLRNLPLLRGLRLHCEGWPEFVQVLESESTNAVVDHAWAARHVLGWRHDAELSAWLRAVPPCRKHSLLML